MFTNFFLSRVSAHDNIISFHGTSSDKLWLVMELAPCGSLCKVTTHYTLLSYRMYQILKISKKRPKYPKEVQNFQKLA